jgi:hypothetical protein
MIWRSIFLDGWVDAEVLTQAFAQAIGVPARDVAVVDEPQGLLAVPEHVRLILERDRRGGAFPTLIVAVLRDPALERRLDGFPETLTVIADVARRLGRTVAVDDGPIEPWEAVRVRPNGVADIVGLDSDDRDDASYHVVAVRPLPHALRDAVTTTG